MGEKRTKIKSASRTIVRMHCVIVVIVVSGIVQSYMHCIYVCLCKCLFTLLSPQYAFHFSLYGALHEVNIIEQMSWLLYSYLLAFASQLRAAVGISCIFILILFTYSFCPISLRVPGYDSAYEQQNMTLNEFMLQNWSKHKRMHIFAARTHFNVSAFHGKQDC